jgi:DNA-damage-inducible protein D
MSCESVGATTENHFLETRKVIRVGKGAQVERKDYYLSRYACSPIALLQDSAKILFSPL